MTPLPFVWPYTVAFWLVYLWAFFPEFSIVRRAAKEATATDEKSLQVIMGTMSLSIFFAFPLSFVASLQVHAFRVPVYFLGVLMLFSGSLLRRHCFRMLGRSFTGDVRVRDGQEIVTRGAYSILRHPSYTGGILMNTGIGVALGSWASALLLFVVALAGYTYRMNVEERALAEKLGEPYREFMRTRKRVIPFIY